MRVRRVAKILLDDLPARRCAQECSLATRRLSSCPAGALWLDPLCSEWPGWIAVNKPIGIDFDWRRVKPLLSQASPLDPRRAYSIGKDSGSREV